MSPPADREKDDLVLDQLREHGDVSEIPRPILLTCVVRRLAASNAAQHDIGRWLVGNEALGEGAR